MSHNFRKHVPVYKGQYILPVLPLLVLFMTSDLLFCLWLLLELREETLNHYYFQNISALRAG